MKDNILKTQKIDFWLNNILMLIQLLFHSFILNSAKAHIGISCFKVFKVRRRFLVE